MSELLPSDPQWLAGWRTAMEYMKSSPPNGAEMETLSMPYTTGHCACCDAPVRKQPIEGQPCWCDHGLDRESGEPCPRSEWPANEVHITDY